jgi:hypothetical protein
LIEELDSDDSAIFVCLRMAHSLLEKYAPDQAETIRNDTNVT